MKKQAELSKIQLKVAEQMANGLEASMGLHTKHVDALEKIYNNFTNLHKSELDLMSEISKKLIKTESRTLALTKQITIIFILLFGLPAILLSIIATNYLFELYTKSQPGEKLNVILTIVIACTTFILGRFLRKPKSKI